MIFACQARQVDLSKRLNRPSVLDRSQLYGFEHFKGQGDFAFKLRALW